MNRATVRGPSILAAILRLGSRPEPSRRAAKAKLALRPDLKGRFPSHYESFLAS